MWAGSAFMCQAGEISLRHVRFLEAFGECNNDAVIGRGIEIANNSYTSHLYITLTPELVGKTVTCSVDDGTNLISVGASSLTVSTSEYYQILRHEENTSIAPLYMCI